MYMSIYRNTNLKSYWGKNAFAPNQNTTPVKQLMAIKKYLSFQDETQCIRKGQPGYDPLFCIRKLADKINNRFDSIPKTARLCVDEQMYLTKLKHHLRQNMPNKLHKLDVKLFVLCYSLGYAYRFEIYNGADDNVTSWCTRSREYIKRWFTFVKDHTKHCLHRQFLYIATFVGLFACKRNL